MKPDLQLVDFNRWNEYLGGFYEQDGRLRAWLPLVLSAKSELRTRAGMAIEFYSKRGLPPAATLGVGDFLYDIADGHDPGKLSHAPGRIAEPRTLLMGADYFIRRHLLLGTDASDATICLMTAKVWGRGARAVREAYEAHAQDVQSLVFTWLAAATQEYRISSSRQTEILEAYQDALATSAPDAGK